MVTATTVAQVVDSLRAMATDLMEKAHRESCDWSPGESYRSGMTTGRLLRLAAVLEGAEDPAAFAEIEQTTTGAAIRAGDTVAVHVGNHELTGTAKHVGNGAGPLAVIVETVP